MKKLLYIENIASIQATNFYMSAAMAAKQCGYEFHLAYNAYDATDASIKFLYMEYGVYFHQVDFIRKPYDIRNIKAYWQICELIRKEKIDVIHCNTPIGGIVGRFAGKKCGISSIIYQAHGFHFYEGAPKLNWFVYYPIEKWLAHYTDILVTINQEDYERAQTFKLRNNGKVYYVPGVGINTFDYKPRDEVRRKKRLELGLKDSDIAIISAGDLIERKNYKTSIEAIAWTENHNVQYFICGQGIQKSELEKLAKKLNISSQIHFLGFRTDMKEILQAADIFLSTTLQEGLSRSIMEAMASGLPCVASKIRGNTDLLIEGKNGYLVDAKDAEGFGKSINILAGNEELRKAISLSNMYRICEFDISVAEKALIKVYKNIFDFVY